MNDGKLDWLMAEMNDDDAAHGVTRVWCKCAWRGLRAADTRANHVRLPHSGYCSTHGTCALMRFDRSNSSVIIVCVVDNGTYCFNVNTFGTYLYKTGNSSEEIPIIVYILHFLKTKLKKLNYLINHVLNLNCTWSRCLATWLKRSWKFYPHSLLPNFSETAWSIVMTLFV